MEKRLVLAVALSILIIVSFQYFFVKPPVRAPDVKGVVKEDTAPVRAVVKEAAELPPSLEAPSNIAFEEEELEADAGKYILTFSNVGGSIKKIRLKEHKNPHSTEMLDLVDLTNPKMYVFSFSDSTGSLPFDTIKYNIEKSGDDIIASARIGDIEVVKRYVLHNSKHIIELDIAIKNISGSSRSFGYRIIGGSGLKEPDPQDVRFIEVRSKVNGIILNFKHPKKGRITNPGIVSWTAIKNKYFCIVMKPFGATKDQFYSEAKDGLFSTGIESPLIEIPSGSVVSQKFILYAGPSQISLLKEVGFEFAESVDYGFFGGISRALIAVMRFFYFLLHSWGLSIILLSIFLNLILSPLTFKSFKSMQKMQALHPQMEKLKAQHKDNPQKLNKEMLELYKKYKINPLSGCLPMLLQMPIFIALYNALIRSIELRGSTFLWIRDLSLPDAVKIPITLPIFGDSINILPLLMVGAMVLQQNMSTKQMGSAVTDEQKQQQRMMLIVMPIVFGFIFYNMPSGLVLYWIINTVLTVVEQYAIFKNI
ncbi:MAG: membrane protein insertase YidC [Candidatus Omnitrophota bacterium]